MSLWAPLVVYALVLALGAPLALWWGRVLWKSPKIQKKLAERSYEGVRAREVQGTQLLVLTAWPVVLPALAAGRAWSWAVSMADPHVSHQVELEAQVERWKSLAQLQRRLGQEVDVEIPQAWCSCQREIERQANDGLPLDVGRAMDILRQVEMLMQEQRDQFPTGTVAHARMRRIASLAEQWM